MFTLFDHTADLGLRVEAADLNALFREAAEGLFAMMTDDPASIRPNLAVPFAVTGSRTASTCCSTGCGGCSCTPTNTACCSAGST